MRLAEAQRLSEGGRYQALLDYLDPVPRDTLESSPTLALLYGSAHTRLGRDAEAEPWVKTAVARARKQGDPAVETRGLNVLGAIALEGGRMEEASQHLTRALEVAKRLEDHATIGRCSNNLGIIADQQGEYAEAASWYKLALAAYQQAGFQRGIAETHHNLAMTHLAKGDYKPALEQADHAVGEASKLGDEALYALTLSGRAEIRALKGDVAFAQREIERALETHHKLGDVVGEAQDLRIVAIAAGKGGDADGAEKILAEVIFRAEQLQRPHLAATASRELARLLEGLGRLEEAREIAQGARASFESLGAQAEARKLDDLVGGTA